MSFWSWRVRLLSLSAFVGTVLLLATQSPGGRVAAQSGCGPTINAITCENQNPGNPASEWDISGAGDSTIQGFATSISVAPGDVEQFKIDTTASSYAIAIYRMGYYGGFGARKIAAITPSAVQRQPACLTQSSSGLIDCGNWGVSASWTVPANAVSGIYFALLTRTDTGGKSHIFFIVRDDTGNSDLVFQTSDTTWQAYNQYGGNSLYVGGPGTNPSRAYKVSYNRPITTRSTGPEDFVFNAEYPMVRFLEANGYNVSYISGVDTDRFGATLLTPAKHRVFMSVGHDEYWSGGQRANVEAARNAGMHLAFFSGDEMFWKTRWESSIDGSNTPYRTLVTYKETHANKVIDPADPPTWTGSWRDPRFSPPADGGRPENAVTGQWWKVNEGTAAITVPAAYGKFRLWRNTSVATLTSGQTATFTAGTLGYEWDESPTNPTTPSGLMRLSSTTVNVQQALLDYGSTFGAQSVTHNLTLYRHPTSGALVFGAGSIQWSWGLDSNHDRGSAAADVRMQQATVNLLADMNAQPQTLIAGLVSATASPDALPPASTITSPTNGSSFAAGVSVTVSGTATDSGGGFVAGVEVSTDGGATWKPATGTSNWTYTWVASGTGTVTIKSRAFDDTGNFETPSAGVAVTVTASRTCPCSIWGTTANPAKADDGDTHSIEVGIRFRTDTAGYVTGVRFYKGSTLNTGTHTGSLWTNSGTLLGTVTFTNETSTGWQQANFANAIAIAANTTYVVSYHAPSGHYSSSGSYFASAGVNNPPLYALQDGVDGATGVYVYASGTTFPNQTYQSEFDWVDVVFNTAPPTDTTPPTVTAFNPASGASGVDPATSVLVTFSEAMDPTTISVGTSGGEGGSGTTSNGTFELHGPSNLIVPASVSYNATTHVATLTPGASLGLGTTYTMLVKGGGADPRVKDVAGNAMTADVTWSFTTAASPPPPPGCPCSLWTATTIPGSVDDGDAHSTEVGTRFRSDVPGYITGARFYKNSLNTGTHTATLWTNTGTALGSATFTGEAASGWQQVTFATPIPINANTTYVISYHASNGHYSSQNSYFATSSLDAAPLHGLKDGADGANGVYLYSSGTAFPTQTYQSEAYFVDVIFNTTIGVDTTPPTVSSINPGNGALGVSTLPTITANFSEALDSTTVTPDTFFLTDPGGASVASTLTYTAANSTATLTFPTPLSYSTTYTATIRGGATGVKDIAGNALAADFVWTFTTAAPPPPPPSQGPGGPILVITAASNAFSVYYAEILRTEGANEFLTMDISQVTASTLASYDAVILGQMPLTSAQVSMLSTWVNNGGTLIAMRPDKQLAGLLGLQDAAATLSDAYLLINGSGPGAGIVNQTMQFHGTADKYSLATASALAWLYADASTSTPFPAVTTNTVGAGRAIAFAYDLARSIVYTRQGNPVWNAQERDGVAPIRSDDLYFGAKTGDVHPDYVDWNKIQIPQADEQQRFLWNVLLAANGTKKPLPRFWYLPRMLKAAVVMTGDDHANGGTAGRFDAFISESPANCNVANWECVRGTSYMFAGDPITNAQVQAYVAQGFEVALHAWSSGLASGADTGQSTCNNFTATSLAADYSLQLAKFKSLWPAAGAPKTNRTHCITWSDYATQPQVELNNGIRLDTSYYFYPSTWVNDRPGLFTGSGMPMRFADLAGNLIDVFQATSQMTDESGQTYPNTINTLLANALGPQGYYGVFTANMHTDSNTNADGKNSLVNANFIVSAAQANGVPVVSSRQMLDWLDGRNGSSFQSLSWNGSQLTFTLAIGVNATGLTVLLPNTFNGSPISSLLFNNAPVSYTVQTIKGVDYAVFAAQPGPYQVSYGADATPPVISSVVATPGATTATITWTTNEPSTSRVDYGTPESGLSSSATNSTLVTSHSIALTGLLRTTGYQFRVTSADASGNTATSPTPPAALSFTTVNPSLSGTISPVAAGSGAQVILGGALITTTADGSGNYTFTNLASGGTYPVTVQKSGYTFTPASQSVTVGETNVSGINFTGQPVTISGTVTGGAGATVTLSGAANATTTTDGSGNYVFSAVANGSYTVAASKTGNTVTPASQPVTVSNGTSVPNVNFTATATTISGTIAGGSGATVTLSGAANATTTADASGNYTFSSVANGSYTVTPSKSGYTFSPASQAATVSGGASVTGLNFTAQPVVISGTITGAAGVTVTLNGGSPVTTDVNGNYTFSAVANGTYTVAPGKSGFTFNPPTQSVTVAGSSRTGINFTAQPLPTYTISGTISTTSSGTNASVTMTLSGAASATTITDASGNYAFNGLYNGSYTIVPSKSGVTFSPATQSVTIANASQPGVNFTSQPPPITIDVTVSTDRSSKATTIASPVFSTAAANELLLALISTDNINSNATTIPGVAGGGLTWVLVGRTNSQRGDAEIWRAFATTAVSNATVTATISQSVSASITVMTFTGVDTTGTSGAGAIGAVASGAAASGAPAASLVTTRANSLVIGVGADWDSATARTPGAGQTLVHQYLATVGDTYWVQRTTSAVAAAGTAVTINDTAPTGDRYDLTICEVRAGG